ncbi:MAG: radical SAM family heme chaperone HemW [Hyphomonadaceae bacterium]
MSDPAFGIYVHWPYCARICPYCDFNVARDRGGDHGALLNAILADLRAHAAQLSPRRVDTLFFGGGTPSRLPPADIARIIEAAAAAFGFSAAPEISLECNPEDFEAFAGHAAAGINRFSLGVLALDDEALRRLGRAQHSNTARRAIERAAKTGARVSLDLIYAREGQGVEAWRNELRAALSLPVEHLSLYQLTIEAGTAFARAAARGRLSPPNAEEAASLYEVTQEICEEGGFPAYEISNHARAPAAQSRHNLLYWRGGEWLGLGPGAHGRFVFHGARRASAAPRAVTDYIAAVAAGPALAAAPALTEKETVAEAVLMGLRLREGLDRARLAAYPPPHDQIDALVEAGLLLAAPDRLTLTAQGRLLADRIAAMLAP